MRCFDQEIEKLVKAGVVDVETALAYAEDSQALQKSLEKHGK